MDPQLMTFLMSLASAAMTNASNRQLSGEQREWSETMQDKQNKYNLPINQVQRLKDAGISPLSLSMGQGMAFGGNTSSPVQQYGLPSLLDPMSIASNSLLSMSKANETNTLLEERKKNIEAQTAQYQAQAQLLGLNSEEQQIVNRYCAALNEAALIESYSEIGLNTAQIFRLNADIKKMAFELEKVLPQQVKESISREKLNILEQDRVVALIANIEADTELKKEETNTEQLQQSLIETEITHNETSSEYISTLSDDVHNQIKLFLDTYEDQVAAIAASRHLTEKQAQWFIASKIAGTAVGVAGLGLAGVKAAKTGKASKSVGYGSGSSATW